MNRFTTRLLTILLLLAAPRLVRAGGDEVVVIYNSNLPESKAVAEHYAEVRQVPRTQIYGFKMPEREEISRAEFRDTLQLPLGKKLESGGFWKFGSVTIPATNGQPERVVKQVIASKIRYAVLCWGVPLKIRDDAEIHDSAETNIVPELRGNQAAVDSELALLPLGKVGLPLTGPYPNRLYGVTNAASMDPTNGIFMVARLDGPTPEIARGLVDKALVAERDGLWGRAYFDARHLDKSSAYFIGDEWILGSAQICGEMGFETIVDNLPETFPASLPLSQIAIYCGWYNSEVCGPFALPKVEFMPGAFAYHLHSYSASTVRSATDNWVGPLLDKGAACTMGCVYEPYISGTPNPAAFFIRWAALGFTFGEAAYAAQGALSWQITVVGDPLYRPFGKTPQERHAELLQEKSPMLDWSYLRLADLALAHGARPAEVAQLLENLNVTTNSAVLTEKLADLFSRLGKPSSAILTYQKALDRNPSPEQRIRLRLALGEKLLAQGRNAEADENYRKLMVEAPDYPGKIAIEEKLTNLMHTATTNSTAQP